LILPNEPYKSHTVIEFKWDQTLIPAKFVPLRTRWDKTSNPNKHGNYVHVACSIWNNINNPITMNTLFNQMNNNTTPNTDGEKSFFFERMTNFHTKINKYLINKYTAPQKNPIVLEFSPYGSNCKNNLSYYQETKDITLHSFEFESQNSKNNIRESCKNVKKLGNSVKNYDFMETTQNLLENSKHSCKYDTIFSTYIYNFFKSNNSKLKLAEFINYRINKNGYFIISFIDYNLFKNTNRIKYNKDDTEIMYYIKQDDNENFSLYLNSLTYENNTIPVYKNLDKQKLIDTMESIGFTCIETENYSTLDTESVFGLMEY
jgi:hypothetical protein